MYSYKRNRQPSLRGSTFRVESPSLYAERDITYLRESIEEACARAGALYAHWRRYTPGWNEGPCPVCNITSFEGPTDSDCRVCYGTGFEGGYSKPSVQWMVIQSADETIERTEWGYIRIRKTESLSPYIPNINTGDLIARIIKGESPFSGEGNWRGLYTQERFVVTGTVRKHRMRESSEILGYDTEDHLDPVPEIVGYTFDANLLNPNEEPDRRPVEYLVPFREPIWLAKWAEDVR